MNVHKNARLTYHSRCHIVKRWEAGDTPRSIASAVGVSPASVYKWLRRYKLEGFAALRDRTSRPHKLYRPTSSELQTQVETLRCTRMPCWKIAIRLGLSRATVARICKRRGLSRLSSLEVKPPVIRYEKQAPGEMIHIDIKKLGRIKGVGHRITGRQKGYNNKKAIGWEYLHLAVDDHSRLAYSQILPDEKKESCVRFLFNALRFFKSHGITVQRVMTDNGGGYRSHAYARAMRRLHISHKFTRPFTPRTNGKAERFVQTSLREWAYAQSYQSSGERQAQLLPFLHHYNYHRTHFGINGQTPISRLSVNNLSRHNS
jgi:transposase InsO family protein